MCFVKFLFHLSEVAVSIDFAREKKMFFTGFTHCKVGLWKSCELDLWRKSPVNCLCIEGKCSKSAISVLKTRFCSYSINPFRSGLLSAHKHLAFRLMSENHCTGRFTLTCQLVRSRSAPVACPLWNAVALRWFRFWRGS